MTSNTSSSNTQFLAGGGEMGRLIREKDWSDNPMGDPRHWPQSLRTTLGILLNSKFPMFLWWGPELICFYNDAYRPSLGQEGKHPSILGMKAVNAWPEIWDIIKPMIDSVIATGEATWNEDALIPIYRNNRIEDVYWTFSYSPVYGETGEVGGVLVTCNETTQKVNTLKLLNESSKRYLNNIQQAPIAMCVMRGSDFKVEVVNEKMLRIWGKKINEVINKPIFDGVPEAKEQGLEALLVDVFTTGEKFVAQERPVLLSRKGKIETTYIDFVYEALKESDGTISGIVATANEVTDQVQSRSKLEQSEQKARNIVENAPFAIAVYVGEEMRIELANQAIMDIWGKGNDVIGKTYTEILPELVGQSIFEQVRDVYATGKPFHKQNQALDLVVNGKLGTYYFNYDFTPLYDLSGKIYGVMNTGTDVSAINLAKQQIEESNMRFRNTVKQAPVGIIILRTKDYVVETANDAYMQIVDRKESEFIGKPLFESIPEAKESTTHLMDHVMDTGESYRGYEVPVPLEKNGEITIHNFDFVYHPLKEDDGSISGIIVTVSDVTEKVMARRKIEEGEKRFRNTVKQAPSAIAIFRGRDYVAEMANDAYLELVDRKEDEFIGRPLFETLPEVKDSVKVLLDGVYDTGIPFHGYEVPAPIKRKGEIGIYNFDLLYSPLREDDGSISGIIVTANEVTEKVESRKKIEQNEERLKIVIEASELGTWELNLKTGKAEYSGRYFEILTGSKKFKQLPHTELIKYLHPDDMQIRKKAMELALETGVLHYEARLIWDDKSIHWMEGKGKVFYNENQEPIKMVGTIRDITNEREAQLMLIKNELKFRLLADTMPQQVWTSDAEGNINYYSESVLVYSGMTLKELFEQGWVEMVHPEDRERTMSAWVDSVTTGREYVFEHRLRRHDGEFRWQLSRAIPQRDQDDNIQMWVGTSTDIQDQKMFTEELEKKVAQRTSELNKTNESLKQSEERYHAMVEEVQDYAIIYLNNEGIIENWNKGAEKIKGYSSEEIIGESFERFYSEQDRANNLPNFILNQARENGRYVHEGWRVRKNKVPFWANVTITAIHNDKGEVIGFSKLTHDLTEKKEAEDILKKNSVVMEQKNEELERMNKELQSFAYISSHDLQEPLRKIQTFSNLIVETELEKLSDSGKDKFKRMQNAAQRMQALINDLLAYSRTNTQEVKLTRTNLKTIIAEVKEDLKEEILQKNAAIELENVDIQLDVVPFQIHQLLFNLIGNSLKFSRRDPAPLIKITCEVIKGKDTKNDTLLPETDYCHIIFSDNGIGFDPQYSEKIFEVFQRLHGKETYQGTGIGLAIVKKIVDNHKGVISATGEKDKGAIFNLYLPVKGS